MVYHLKSPCSFYLLGLIKPGEPGHPEKTHLPHSLLLLIPRSCSQAPDSAYNLELPHLLHTGFLAQSVRFTQNFRSSVKACMWLVSQEDPAYSNGLG